MKKMLLSLLLLFYLSGCSNNSLYFVNKYPDKKERIEWIDSYFVSIDKQADQFLMSEPKYWFRMQEAFYEAKNISEDMELPKETRDYAKYVLAYGYYIAGFYDLCADVQENLFNDVDDKWKIKLLKDMMNNYESMGEYEKHIKVTLEKISAQGKIDERDYNELAVSYLKTGKYKECIEAINKINLNSESAITRVTSASAYGYLKDYMSARNELMKAINYKNKRAENDLKDLESKGDSIFWTEDYQRVVVNSLPENKLDEKNMIKINNLYSSRYFPRRFFDEVFALYGGSLSNVIMNSSSAPGLPQALKDYKYSFSLIEGIPFLTIQKRNKDDHNFSRDINAYNKNIECSAKYLMLDDDTAILYYLDWQKEIIKKSVIKATK